jgi:hypothetical protein
MLSMIEKYKHSNNNLEINPLYKKKIKSLINKYQYKVK